MDNYIKLIMPVYKNIYFKATYVRDQFYTLRSSPVTHTVKNPPAVQETGVQSLGGEDPLGQDMPTHCSVPAWRIPWTEEPGRLLSTGVQRFGHDWATNTYTLNLCHSSRSVSESIMVLNGMCYQHFLLLLKVKVIQWRIVMENKEGITPQFKRSQKKSPLKGWFLNENDVQIIYETNLEFLRFPKMASIPWKKI